MTRRAVFLTHDSDSGALFCKDLLVVPTNGGRQWARVVRFYRC